MREKLIAKLERLRDIQSLIICLMCANETAPVEDMARAYNIVVELSNNFYNDTEDLNAPSASEQLK